MLDLTGIMFSSLMMLVVALRALQMDKTEAWFPKLTRIAPVVRGVRPWQRGR